MIIGTGIDIMLISRMEKSMQSAAFAKKVFSAAEREYIEKKRGAAQTAAGMFCAKEAFLKALGKGIGSIPLADIEVLHTDAGAPCINFDTDKKIHLSISHMGDIAVAQVILEEI